MGKKTIKVCVVSDTHIHSLREIPTAFLEVLKSYDSVIHLGDFMSPELVEYLKKYTDFHGVAGNHDPHAIKHILPKTDVVEINGKRLGLLHGYWFPFFCEHRSLARFRKEKVDAIIYGHTHLIRNEKANNILFFNPGSAQAAWPAPWKTYGILNINDSIKGEIVSMPGKGVRGFSKYTDPIVDRLTVVKWVCGAPRYPDYSVDLTAVEENSQ